MESGVEAQTNYLLNNGLTERISNKKLKIKGKGRLYNPPKPPSKILTKAVGSLYKKQPPNESKPTRRIRNVKDKPAGGVDVFLKYSNIHHGVDTNIFLDFEKDFEDPQKNKNHAQIVELKFRIGTWALILDLDTGDMIGDGTNISITEVFIEAETVYGGDVGLKLYIKYKIMQLVCRFEDSIVYVYIYIYIITFTNMYVSRRKQNAPVSFRRIKMYGSLYNYIGWGLDGGEYDGACFPNYLSETYNNQDETNPRNKISKLNMAKLLELSCMQICMKVAQ